MYYRFHKEWVKNHILQLTCDYGAHIDSQLLFTDYKPESFTIKQKKDGLALPFFKDLSFHDWIGNMIDEQLAAAGILGSELPLASETAFNNFQVFDDVCEEENIEIYNQEAVDVIRRITSYTIYGEIAPNINTVYTFNKLAHSLMPIVVN